MHHIFLLLVLCSGCAASATVPTQRTPGENSPGGNKELAPTLRPEERSDVYRDPKAAVELRVEDLLGRMTPIEKAEMLSGAGWMESHENTRLGIPRIKMADGPMGVRNWTGSSAATNAATTNAVASTAFPAGISMAATWDLDLVRTEGQMIAQQVKALGRDMILGPTVNINRTPLWGRNFEGYGEDPYLAARMAVAYVEGVQGEGVIATVKHFAANNQEYERHRIDEQVDLRTLNEIYFPAFKAAVQEAGVLTVMSAYNKINGRYCAENNLLLADTLKKRWGFKGFVISDWGSTYSTVATIQSGMDLEMPGGEPMRIWSAEAEFRAAGRGAGWLTADKVIAAVESHQLDPAAVDDSVRRILRVMFKVGLFDRTHAGEGEVDTAEQRAVARTAATESMVLLKNDRGLLPLERKKTHTIAVIGPNAAMARTGGGGSSRVRPKYATSPLDGITAVAGATTKVSYTMGTPPMPGDAVEEQPAKSTLAKRQAAVALASKSDVAILVVGNSPKLESESFDRPTMDLPEGQDELIEAVAAVNKNTVVVVVAGAPVKMTRWVKRVSAVLYAWYGGQEAGNAIGDLLFGVANPSGKLPVTFPKRIEDSPAHGNYPGKDLHVTYAEGIYVGYRGFDKKKIEPLFPFGYGLSYSKFEYGGVKIAQTQPKAGEPVTISIDVRNSSSRPGSEIVQLYLRDVESSLERPEQELKGFRRISLEPGETKTVTFVLDGSSMSFFEPKKADWVIEPGVFEVRIGASSRDIRLRSSFSLQNPG